MATTRNALDAANASFWNELCGTALAQSIGVRDSSSDSLKRFDDWYMDFYPYLTAHVPFRDLAGKDVLEVGLGYGTVAQKLAEAGARYTGLDISEGPVEMVNHRLRQNGLPETAVVGNILAPSFPDRQFDAIVTIGCLHHTGNMPEAVDQCHRMLRPGGFFFLMVYNAYSYRRWWGKPGSTFRYFLREMSGYAGVAEAYDSQERLAYDANSSGKAAPHTDFISVRSLRYLCRRFSSFAAKLENIAAEPPLSLWTRERLMKTPIPAWAGLDIYILCRK